jgi:hypothetical protein
MLDLTYTNREAGAEEGAGEEDDKEEGDGVNPNTWRVRLGAAEYVVQA